MIDSRTLYVTSDGRYLSGWQVRRRVAVGDWTKQLADHAAGTVLVESDEGTVIGLTRLAPADHPDWLELLSDGTAIWVADRRRTLPPGQTSGCVTDAPNATVVAALVASR